MIFNNFFLFIALCVSSIVPLSADIVYSGNCGSYHYNLDIPTNKYFGGMCNDNRLYVYQDSSNDYIRSVYVDPAVSDYIDVYRINNQRVDKSFDYTVNNGSIISTTYDYVYRFLALLVGSSVLLISILILPNIRGIS